MSKIIDLDLDFFQNDVVRDFFCIKNEKNGLSPWHEKDVRKYLEDNIGLSSPVKGKILKTHDEAFFFWKELVESNNIDVPFEVDHLDAHSDMGFGDSVWMPMINNYMHLPIEDRKSIPLDKMNEGNYVLFAFAMRWISKFNYIHHEKYEIDIADCWFKDFNSSTCKIQMVACNNLQTDDHFNIQDKINKIVCKDPPIDFLLTDPKSYKNNDIISYINIATSPNYICSSTKRTILPIIKEYIENI